MIYLGQDEPTVPLIYEDISDDPQENVKKEEEREKVKPHFGLCGAGFAVYPAHSAGGKPRHPLTGASSKGVLRFNFRKRG